MPTNAFKYADLYILYKQRKHSESLFILTMSIPIFLIWTINTIIWFSMRNFHTIRFHFAGKTVSNQLFHKSESDCELELIIYPSKLKFSASF